MFNWSKYPLVRFLTAFIIGILLAFYGFIPNIPTIPALAIVVFIAILCLTLLKRFMLKYNILNIGKEKSNLKESNVLAWDSTRKFVHTEDDLDRSHA